MNKKQLLEKLGLRDAFEGYAADTSAELWGWNGNMPVFGELIAETKPALIIEVGTWLGQSCATMAQEIKRQKLDSCVLAIDTFIGSIEHWREMPNALGLQHGFPTLYPRFLSNMINAGCNDTVVPLPMTSLTAAAYLVGKSIQADLIYIDASHEEGAVYDDLAAYWDLLAPGGVMFGDDWEYKSTRSGDPDYQPVKKAVLRFGKDNALGIQTKDGKWRVQKQ